MKRFLVTYTYTEAFYAKFQAPDDFRKVNRGVIVEAESEEEARSKADMPHRIILGIRNRTAEEELDDERAKREMKELLERLSPDQQGKNPEK